MASRGYHFLLIFVLLKCTRGFHGIPEVAHYLLANWDVYVSDFDSFCNGLVVFAEDLTKKKFQSYLSHREGLHLQYSGIWFIRTLGLAEVRQKLVCFAERWEGVIDQCIRCPYGILSPSDLIAIGDSIPQYIGLKLADGHIKQAAKYNSMDITRVLMHMLEYVGHCRPVEYTQDLHNWYLKRQSKRGRQEMVSVYKNTTCEGMQADVQRMATVLKSRSVNVSSMYVLYCETRQVINEYGLVASSYLIEEYDKSLEIQRMISSYAKALSYKKSSNKCSTSECMRAIQEYLGMTTSVLRMQNPSVVYDAWHRRGV